MRRGERVAGARGAGTHLDDGLGQEGVEVGHQLAVDVGHVQVLSHDGDEAHGAVPDPQVGVAQEGSCGEQWGGVRVS